MKWRTTALLDSVDTGRFPPAQSRCSDGRLFVDLLLPATGCVAAARADEDAILLRLDALDPLGWRKRLRVGDDGEPHPIGIVGNRAPELPGAVPAIGALRCPVAVEAGRVAGEDV